MRLVKYLANAGIASRRASEEIIASGRVAVDGDTVTDPARDVGEDNDVTIDGAPVSQPHDRVVYALNKPAGVVSTARDPQRRPTVVSLVPSDRRLYPVGRLDADTTGLILLTDDGELANGLTHPRFGVPKRYRATVTPAAVPEGTLARLRSGVELDDGPTAPATARRIAAGVLELTITEGRKRQVRRMCEAVGLRVVALERVGFGPLELGTLRPGAYRKLTPAQVGRLRAAAAARPAAASLSTAPRRRRPG